MVCVHYHDARWSLAEEPDSQKKKPDSRQCVVQAVRVVSVHQVQQPLKAIRHLVCRNGCLILQGAEQLTEGQPLLEPAAKHIIGMLADHTPNNWNMTSLHQLSDHSQG